MSAPLPSPSDPRRLSSDGQAGRLCPHDYVYLPSTLARTADFSTEALYVVGGLYGNRAALAAVERMAAAERATVVFNGDFHWFDAEPEWFDTIERRTMFYHALRGNVETEIARERDIGAGCGCAYPESVDDGVVRRSNDILAQLAAIAPRAARTRLRALPMNLVAEVGGLRIGIVHGDAASLAGWRFACDALDTAHNRVWLDKVRAASAIDVFASTHTCLAALRDFRLPTGRLTVINNGAAGMPNFVHTRLGLITRIAVTPSPHRAAYGIRRDRVHIDALPVAYDTTAFLDDFLRRWPEGAPAHASYFTRIAEGPNHTVIQAAPQ